MIDAALFPVNGENKERASTKSVLGCPAAEGATLQIDMMLDFVSTTQSGTVTIDSALSMKEGNKEKDSTTSTLSCLAVEGAKLQIKMDTDQFQTAQGVTVTIHAALFLMIQVKKERASTVTVSVLSYLAAQGATLLINMTTEPVSFAKSVTVRIDAVVCLMV